MCPLERRRPPDCFQLGKHRDAPLHLLGKSKVQSTKLKVWALRRCGNLCLSTFAFCTVLLAAPLFPAGAEEPAPVHEATRLLEEEVRLSARPQLYLLLDLPARVLIVKSHGMELRRFPIEAWSVSHESELRRLFK